MGFAQTLEGGPFPGPGGSRPHLREQLEQVFDRCVKGEWPESKSGRDAATPRCR